MAQQGGAPVGAASGGRRRRTPVWLRASLLVPLLLATALGSPAAAQVANFSLNITIQGPSFVTPGETTVDGGLAIVNNSTGLGPVTLTSITYHPSCADFNLACAAPEPGVFTVSPTAAGGAGTGCAGVSFTVSSDGNGRYTFTPSTPIVLAPGATCTISFTFNVLRVPTTDAQPGTPGIQTVRSAIVSGTATATAGGTVTGTSRNVTTITVGQVQTSIATQVSAPTIVLGSAVTDTATVTGAPNVARTGTVQFRLFGPGDTNCTGATIFTSTVPLASGTATSAPFTPTQLGTYRWTATYSGDANNSAVAGVCNAPNESFTVVPPGTYHALPPVRILDTRDGTGGFQGAIAPASLIDVQVTDRGGVPASGVSAVVLNVTVTQPTAVAGYLTVFPSGTPLPLASNLNFTPNQSIPNLVIAKVGANGRVSTYNSDGNTHVIFDVAGWFSDTDTGNAGRYRPLVPTRILDTRNGTGGGVRLGPNSSLDLQVTGAGGVPATGVDAAVLNVVATGTTATSFVTVYPTGTARPLVSNLNFDAGDTVANRAIVKLGSGGRVTIYNLAGGADIVVDVGGWFTDASAAATGVPATGVTAVALNVTATQAAALGFLTVFPSGNNLPLASDLNFDGGETRPNLAIVRVGTGGKVTLYVSASTHVIFDVEGWFT